LAVEEVTSPRAGRPTALGCAPSEGPRASPRSEAASLAAKPEPSDDGPVARAVLLHQIREKAAALADELEEAAARMIVFGEASKMRRQLLDPLGDERDLDLRRPRVTVLGGIPGDDLLLLLPRERHSVLRHDRLRNVFHL